MAASTQMMDTYRLAVVGSGSMAQCHTYAFNALRHYYRPCPTFVPAVVASPSPERRDEFAKRNGFEAAVSPEELWVRDDVDGVFLAGPNSTHFEHLIAATEMKSIRRIYLEKPICASRQEMEELSARLTNWPSDKTVQIGYQFLQMGAFRKALSLIREGVFTDPVCISARYLHSGYLSEGYRRSRQHRLLALPAGGAAVDLGSHVLSMLVALLGDEIEVIAAGSSGRFRDVPAGSDLCTNVLIRENRSGATGTITASRISAGSDDLLEIEIHYLNGALRLSTEHPDILETFQTRSGARVAHHCGNDYRPLSSFPAPKVASGWIRPLIHAHYLFLGGVDPWAFVPDLKHGLVVQRLLQGIADKLREGCGPQELDVSS